MNAQNPPTTAPLNDIEYPSGARSCIVMNASLLNNGTLVNAIRLVTITEINPYTPPARAIFNIVDLFIMV